MLPDPDLEHLMRQETVCRGCQTEDLGTLVCWHCFKYRDDIQPLKYWPHGVASWLNLANP